MLIRFSSPAKLRITEWFCWFHSVIRLFSTIVNWQKRISFEKHALDEISFGKQNKILTKICSNFELTYLSFLSFSRVFLNFHRYLQFSNWSGFLFKIIIYYPFMFFMLFYENRKSLSWCESIEFSAFPVLLHLIKLHNKINGKNLRYEICLFFSFYFDAGKWYCYENNRRKGKLKKNFLLPKAQKKFWSLLNCLIIDI